jgi:hypothetical protein
MAGEKWMLGDGPLDWLLDAGSSGALLGWLETTNFAPFFNLVGPPL